ncbi:MAG: transcriptional repressor LexA [Chlorobi bacterium]|nr:transcriptional repressor LexA [Chlorobiota bacterium]
MKKTLTDRQKEIYNFIKNFIELNGYPPTYREIGFEFDISSTFGVKRHIDALIKKGFLNIAENSSRTLSINEPDSNSTAQISDTVEIPIVGRVAAGQPILAEENVEGTFSIHKSLINGKSDCFALRVKGDSMINAGIFEGDVVIVNPQKDANNGEIIVALLGNEATLKRFERRNNKIALVPENDKYDKIRIKKDDDFSIVGKALGVFRWYN